MQKGEMWLLIHVVIQTVVFYTPRILDMGEWLNFENKKNVTINPCLKLSKRDSAIKMFRL